MKERAPPKPPPNAPLSELPVAFPLGEEDPSTPARNARLVLYQRLVACVDALSLPPATDLVEIACLFADATPAERAVMLRVARAILSG